MLDHDDVVAVVVHGLTPNSRGQFPEILLFVK